MILACPACSAPLTVSDAYAVGGIARCGDCRALLKIAGPNEATRRADAALLDRLRAALPHDLAALKEP